MELMREDGHAGHVEPLAAEHRGEPPRERKHNGVRNQVRGQDPGAFVNAGGEVAGDVRKRDIGHAGIEHFHENRQHHREGNQPRVGLSVLSSSREQMLHDQFRFLGGVFPVDAC